MNTGQAKQDRESVRSKLIVLRQTGQEDGLDEKTIKYEADLLLKSFLRREHGIEKVEQKSPLHIEIMQQQELVGYEPASDVGHFRFYPKGELMKDLIEDLAGETAKKLGALKIGTPLLYRAEQEDIASQAASFHERDYRINLEDRNLLLRFAGDFGLFSMMKAGQISYRNLPLRVYESSNSFRLEQSGECSGLKRLRAFTMPDIHCFTRDLDEGMVEFKNLNKFYADLLEGAELPFATAYRTTEEFFEKNKDYFVSRLRDVSRDGLVELLETMKHYWVMKNEFQYIDSIGDNVQLSTVQLDISDSERYGLKYIDRDGQKKNMIIVHSSMGSIERLMGAVLEERGKELAREEKATYPYWLAPTQLRLIPVVEGHIKYCYDVANSLPAVRIDIDDRINIGLSKRVRAAEKEWVAMYLIIGDKEKESGEYEVNLRNPKGNTKINIDLLGIAHLTSDKQGKAVYRDSYLPREVSKQVRFGSWY